MRFRSIAAFAIGTALITAVAANTVSIPTCSWITPSPTEGVFGGYVYAPTGHVSWSYATTAGNGYYTGTPHFNIGTRFTLFRMIAGVPFPVGTYVYKNLFYYIPEGFSGSYDGVAGQYYFSIYAEADQYDGLKYRDWILFPWNLSHVSGT